MTANEQGLLAGLELLLCPARLLKPNKITKDEVKK
jgi:hypothetical protein